jgi:ribosome-associated translation inhibitor RaiA
MHFDIDAAGTAFPIEARAYLEYRLFSVLSRYDADVFAVRVRLRVRRAHGAPSIVDCRIHVLLRPVGEAVVETQADRLYRAIDQGAEAAGAAVDQLVANAV